jgi:solute:Na+ symporter, SSS family
MLVFADYALIAFYFAFIFAIGFVFRRINRNTSDYFRGSGTLLWWMVGASAFMQQISAFTFTGAAGKAYRDGSIVTVVFFANALAYFINYLWTAARFRQMRVITPVEGVRERFGPFNEQFFTWLQMPVNLISAGIWLNALAVFIAAIFQVDLVLTILVAGGAVLIMSVTGGSWAVVASDFVQMLVLMLATVAIAILALAHPAIGGIGGFLEKAPSHYFNWTEAARPEIVWLWVLASFTKQAFGLNNMMDSSRYLCVRDSQQARKAALLAGGLMLIGPFIWFIPSMVAGILAPDLSGTFPRLADPGDASLVYTGFQVLPIGFMGLLLCAMFAATMSSMDSALNRNAGIFVRNFYEVVIARGASSAHLLKVSRITSGLFGLVVIGAALGFTRLKGFPLFDIMLLYGGLVALPASIPLTLGLFIKRTPSWSGWSTVLIGFTYSYYVAKGLDPAEISWFAGDTEFTRREINDFAFLAGVLGNVGLCTTWFLFTKFFYQRSPEYYRMRVEAFFTRMRTPIDFVGEHGAGAGTGRRQCRTLGMTCLLYAGFIAIVGTIVSLSGAGGWPTYLGVSGALLAVGAALWRSGARQSSDM